MEVAAEALARATEIERSYTAPVLALRLESGLDPADATERARLAVASVDPPGSVHWSVDIEPAGVIVRQWGFTPDVAATLAELSRALEQRGVEGRLASHEQELPPVQRATLRERPEELLEAHLRVRGERRHHVSDSERRYAEREGREPRAEVRFYPDQAAVRAAVEAGLRWVGDPPPGAELHSGAALVRRRDMREVRAHLASSIAVWKDLGRVDATAAWESEAAFRLMIVSTRSGDVSLVEGGARLAACDWEPVHAALLHELRAAASWASYGLVKRGRHPGHAGQSITYDWFPALHFGMYNLHHHLYEDVLATDAFGAQLLGRGYAGRIPSGPDWEHETVDGDSVLLLHRDPAAWFAEPLPPITPDDCIRRDPSYPTPTVLLSAREDLADILIHDDILRRGALDPVRE